ncbi:MAG TPA: tRNA (adenosine(37)-N6)-threonylcarbamoyltransferase complex transferase subunit TsaD [Ktedonobacteraceae bacterium]|jgi:N6-L-threonylcarbamoyladenine synthase|nr:tRNA (adenosine(37)-N6)-threonylcarbamoyltransferase complex transferase subunit TsaD [Ktedonobacteraceae bacterium]
MLVLGIESSCDEAGAALVRDGRYILSNVVASQIAIHNRYGGVVPEVASRQQLSTLLPVIETALAEANCSLADIDAVAATYGPGLAGSLLVGLTVGKTLALACDLPFLGVNHLEAHVYANWLRKDEVAPTEAADWNYQPGDPQFPLLCLVVSGAHSELVLVRDHGHYELLGRTRDDAAGEAFDKVARILGLDYPGGPSIQHAAEQAEQALLQQHKPVSSARSAYRLPRAWLRGTYDFSFSGLKTAMLHLAEGASGERTSDAPHEGKQVSQYMRMGAQAAAHGVPDVSLLAASFQEAIVDVLAVKTRMAAQEYQVQQVILAGGVAANASLRARLEQELLPLHIRLSYPPVAFCTDNAAMIASGAFFHLSRGERHSLDLDVQPGLSLPFRT